MLIVVGLALGACSGDTRDDLYVSAAASLSDVFSEIEVSFEATNPGVDVVLNFGGSSTLAHQIEEGAPIDLFASADEKTMTRLVEEGFIGRAPAIFAFNKLQIVVPAGNPGGVVGLESFVDGSLLLGACAESVPCGRLATSVLEEAGVSAAFATREPNVKALLTKVAAGELDAGLVYVTDVDPEVESIFVDSQLFTSYPVAVLSDDPAGIAFVEFLLTGDGSKILEDFGFGR